MNRILLALLSLGSLASGQPYLPLVIEQAPGRTVIEIGFETQTGKAYHIEGSSDLAEYVSLGDVSGTGAPVRITVATDGARQHFYRVSEQEPLIGVGTILNATSPPPDAQIAYGDDPLQFGKLRLPDEEGPHPVVIFIHGGCWLASFDIAHTGPIEEALAAEGYAVWSLEYRRVGNVGGGWPGTFLDIGRGADHLRMLADTYDLDLSRVVASGHSAGGHLALWLAARNTLPNQSELAVADPLDIHGVVGLAPAPDLESLYAEQFCGHVIDGLIGGAPTTFPERYAAASPMQLAPIEVPQIHVIGSRDRTWAPVGRRYLQRAQETGSPVNVIHAPASGHFEMISPTSSTWPLIQEAFRAHFESAKDSD